MRMHVLALALAVMPAAALGLTTENLLTNPGAEAGTTSAWTNLGTSTVLVDNGTFNPGVLPHSGSFDFVGGIGLTSGGGNSGQQGILSQTIDLTAIPGITQDDINQGKVTVSVSAWEQSTNQGPVSDTGQLTGVLRDANGVPLTRVSTNTVASIGGWQQITATGTVPAQTKTMDFQLVFNRNVGTDLNAFFDDASLIVSSSGTPAGAVPEPTVLGMLALGLGGLLLRRRVGR